MGLCTTVQAVVHCEVFTTLRRVFWCAVELSGAKLLGDHCRVVISPPRTKGHRDIELLCTGTWGKTHQWHALRTVAVG